MDEILIEKVREHAVIYNNALPEYRDQHVCQAAWEEIGRELEIPRNKAKERWDNLRRSFCNARNRRRDETRSGMACKKKTLWKYEQQMSFIIPFLENRKTHSNLNESQTSENLATETEDVREGSRAEVDTPGHSDRNVDLYAENGRDNQDNNYGDDTGTDAETVEQHYKEVKLSRNQKQRTNTPAQEMVNVLKENAALRKRRYEEQKIQPNKVSKINSALETIDDTDMFFLSMSNMTKQLPKVEQARIKLALSNMVLSAEIKCNEESFASTSNRQTPIYNPMPMSQQSHLSPVSPAPSSFEPLRSPSDNFSQASVYSANSAENDRRPTLLELVSLPHTQYHNTTPEYQ